jgi:hypothetical protein
VIDWLVECSGLSLVDIEAMGTEQGGETLLNGPGS